jgi:hypothetical protein
MMTKEIKNLYEERKHFCAQCGANIGNEWMAGPICKNCRKKNQIKTDLKRWRV